MEIIKLQIQWCWTIPWIGMDRCWFTLSWAKSGGYNPSQQIANFLYGWHALLVDGKILMWHPQFLECPLIAMEKVGFEGEEDCFQLQWTWSFTVDLELAYASINDLDLLTILLMCRTAINYRNNRHIEAHNFFFAKHCHTCMLTSLVAWQFTCGLYVQGV